MIVLTAIAPTCHTPGPIGAPPTPTCTTKRLDVMTYDGGLENTLALWIGQGVVFVAMCLAGPGLIIAPFWIHSKIKRHRQNVRERVDRRAALDHEMRASSMPPSPTPKGLAEQYQRVGATEESGWPAPAMRAEPGDDAAADWAARVATSKAEKKAAKAASSAAYLKTHGPGTSRGQG